MKRVKVGLVGITGYTGMELLRLLSLHPQLIVTRVTSRSEADKKVADIHPFLLNTPLGDLVISKPDTKDLAGACELVFLAVPHGTAMVMAAELIAAGLKVVDLSSDFRIKDVGVYEQWYGVNHAAPDLLEEAVYGLPEVYGRLIKKARLVANPGCYPTSAILGLYPALKNRLIKPHGLIIDSKSGTTGAGRGAKVGSLFCEVTDNFKAYNLGKHRHTPEIEQELSNFSSKKELKVSFSPHLLPINRGILSTMYATLRDGISIERVFSVYETAYERFPWLRLMPKGELPDVRNVRGTMFCDVGLVVDQRTGRLIVVAAIDNLCRGASGQAVANANLMCGLRMDVGIAMPPLVP